MKLPPHIQTMLWDVHPSKIDIQRHKIFVITRIVEKGNWSDIKWLQKTYPSSLIKKVTLKSKNTSPRVKNFWKNM